MNRQFRRCSAGLDNYAASRLREKFWRKENPMFNQVKNVLMSAVIGMSALAAIPATAQADSLYFSFGGGNEPGRMIVDDVERVRHRDWHRPGYWGRPGCTANRALRKAHRMGLRRTFIARENRRVIVVAGRGLYGRERIAFGRAPGCPVLR
jgi:hypothetical protein